jgi:hypothetical protein
MTAPRTLLVLYYTRGVHPLRSAIASHLYCWRRYSRYRVLYLNVAFPLPDRLLAGTRVDAVLFHTLFLGMRWSRELFRARLRELAAVQGLGAVRIAMPQDEFLNTDLLNEFIEEYGVTHVLSCAEPGDWPLIYDRVDRGRVELRTVLTGYVDPDQAARVDAKRRAGTARDIDIGYRAWRAEYWLGAHAQHKHEIARVFTDAGRARGLRLDISLRDEDVIAGAAWLDFLLRCRATVGVEGGASVLDRDGSIRTRTEAYLREHPGAAFEEVRDACFPGEDGRLGLSCLSPRHLEACMTGTCQLLIEGRYNGALAPGVHYVPVRPDYSNVAEALEAMSDESHRRAIVDAAYRDVIADPRWSYPRLVREIEDTLIEPALARAPRMPSAGQPRMSGWLLGLRDPASWWFIRLEKWYYHRGRRNLVVRAAVAAARRLLRGLARLRAVGSAS